MVQKRTKIAFVALLSGMLFQGCAGVEIPQELIDAALATTEAQQGDRTTAGLREALEVATGRAVDQTSRAGGFSADDLIRIRLPEELDTATRVLRAAGFGGQIDNLEGTMNLAAERAAAEATPIFVDAVRGLTFQDAQQILTGGDTAATDYFRGRTESNLVARFAPEVQEAMRSVGLYREYESILGTYNSLPFTDKPNLDLADYVTDRTTDGLFEVLGREEKRIREDPVARTTELLREVFGN